MKATPIDFDEDIRTEILAYLPYDRTDSNCVLALNSLPTSRLLVVFLNWRERLIHPHPRAVHLSNDLISNELYLENRKDVDRLCGKIRSGNDLTPHLSERVRNGYLPRDSQHPLRDNPSLDLLLNDWGMHHLHISHELWRNGFLGRRKEIVVAIFREHAAFLVDIVGHASWTDTALIRTAMNAWPDEKFFVKLNGFLGSQQRLTSNERTRLRRTGCSTMIEVDGAMLVPATGGISTAGTSTRVGMLANQILSKLHEFENDPQCLVDIFENCAAFEGTRWPQDPSFRFRWVITPSNFMAAIFEMSTGKIIGLS